MTTGNKSTTTKKAAPRTASNTTSKRKPPATSTARSTATPPATSTARAVCKAKQAKKTASRTTLKRGKRRLLRTRSKILKISTIVALLIVLGFLGYSLLKNNSKLTTGKGGSTFTATGRLPRVEPIVGKNITSSTGRAPLEQQPVNQQPVNQQTVSPPVVEELSLSRLSQKTDVILTEMLENASPKGSVKILDMEHRAFGKETYLFQKISLLFPASSTYKESPDSFEEELRARLTDLDQSLELAAVSPFHYIISKNSLVSHEIFLQFAPVPESETLLLPRGEARLAIVIDDVGANEHALNRLLSLSFPVTIAIWPRAAYAKESAEKAHVKNLEIIVHQPMEPIAYPHENPGPGAILNKMTDVEIERIIKENIALVPYAVGLNNHMGSRLTQNKTALESVLMALKDSGFFVLDSVTIEQTKFYTLAKAEGFKAQKRDIFLDVKKSKKDVLRELDRAERLATTQGYAIAIGHPLPDTLNALEEWQKKRSSAVKIVTVQSLLTLKRKNEH